jgi:hypothetical protein
MIRAFQIFKQFLNFFEVWQSQLHRLHYEWLSDRLPGGRQARAQKAIYDLLERLTGLARFLIQKAGNVIVEGKSGSHIMMLYHMTS